MTRNKRRDLFEKKSDLTKEENPGKYVLQSLQQKQGVFGEWKSTRVGSRDPKVGHDPNNKEKRTSISPDAKKKPRLTMGSRVSAKQRKKKNGLE